MVGLLLVGVVLAVFAVVGLRARRGGQDLDDYMVARGSQGAATLGLSFLASGMGAWILFAPPEVGALVGGVAVAGYALGAAAPILCFAWLGPRLRAAAPQGSSLVAFVRARFGRTAHGAIVAVSAAYMLVFVSAELTAVGAVTAILTGADPRLVIVGVAAVTLTYTALGGLRASLRTDRWQAWFVLGLLAAVAVAVVAGPREAGGAAAAPALLRLTRPGLESAATLLLAVTAANLLHQGYWQRVWAARDDGALRRGAVLGGALSVPVVAIVGGLGVLAAVRGLDLGSPPAPLFALLAGLPGWVGVVVLLLGVALVTSSVDTLENGLAALVAAERPRLPLAAARWATVALVVPAVVVAVQGHSVLRLFLVADVLAAAVVVPALLGLWPRATAAGAVAGGVAGLAGAVLPGWVASGSLAEGVLRATFPGAVPTLAPFAGALVASSVVAMVVSLAARRVTDVRAAGARIAALGSRSG